MVQISFEEVKKIEISILDYIDKRCQENGIKYFLAYGTLLGAVRHKGFIPWDDDIDICMYRADYDKFVSLMSQDDSQSRFRFLNPSNDKQYYYEFSKIVDSRTMVLTNSVKKIDNEGVWVDIFPIDNLSRFPKVQKFLVDVVVGLRIMSVYQTFQRKKWRGILYPIWMISKLVGPRPFLYLSDFFSRIGTDPHTVGYIASRGTTEYKFPRSFVNDVTEVRFEDRFYSTFSQYDRYLTVQYGDYMKLPPEDKRVPHPVVAVWR